MTREGKGRNGKLFVGVREGKGREEGKRKAYSNKGREGQRWGRCLQG